jgi:hypothetical protein
MKYTIDDSDCFDEGGSAEFFHIKEDKKLGFKQFKNKKNALIALRQQKLLHKFGLAPKVIGGICKLNIEYGNYSIETNWGFITEKARLVSEDIMSKRLKEIQKLVDNIHQKTGLKFWDCHYYNIGYIQRKNKSKLVCIDTGSESFKRDSNAWGFSKPGPKCNYCNKYQCSCVDY